MVVRDRAPDAPPVRAKIGTALLTCDGVDEAQLQAFADKRGNAPVQPHERRRRERTPRVRDASRAPPPRAPVGALAERPCATICLQKASI